jgi:hypothetical protein
MAVKVTIQFEGVQEVMQRLTEIEEKAEKNVETITKQLAEDTEKAWKDATPYGKHSEKRKTPHLRDEDKTVPSGLTFVLQNSVYYYKFVDEGHNTPKGWMTKHGFREAKKNSYVKGQEITKKATDFVEQHTVPYLSKFLDNV